MPNIELQRKISFQSGEDESPNVMGKGKRKKGKYIPINTSV